VARRPTTPTTPAPTEEDWRRVIANFKRNRDFDRAEFRKEAEDLAEALKRAAGNADDAALRMERTQPAELSTHDGPAIVKQLTENGHRKQLQDLAGLDLLVLVPIEPWLKEADPHGRLGVNKLIAEETLDIVRRMEATALNVPLAAVDNDEQRARRDHREEIFERWGLNASAEPLRHRPSVLLRRQAEFLYGGADRLQELVNDHVRRANAIKPAVSVALHELLEATEPWKLSTVQIAERLVDGHVRPGRIVGRSADPPRAITPRERGLLIKKWDTSLRQFRLDWRRRARARQRAKR
jgi:hypothetical protein